MTSTTATVETLTAEVRVLKVGSRQVTMSVYNQLDYAGYDETELFGRVHPRDRDPEYAYLVGMNRKDGTLVRVRVPVTESAIKNSSTAWNDYRRPLSEAQSIDTYLHRHRNSCGRSDHSDCRTIICRNRKYLGFTELVTENQRLTDTAEPLRSAAEADIQRGLSRADRVKALPLIVLAGLR